MVKISQYVKPKRIFSPKPAHVSISHRRKIKRTGIFDLPPELIELIIKQLTPWNGRIFRASCKQAKAAYDGYTWHQLNRELFRCLKNLPQTMTSYTVLKVIPQMFKGARITCYFFTGHKSSYKNGSCCGSVSYFLRQIATATS